jgi:membrane-bound lytic murein transglycosylase D
MPTLLRIPLFTATLAFLPFICPPASAQDAVQAELAQLRKQVEQQNAKIDALTDQIARLNVRLDNAGLVPSAPIARPVEVAAPVPRVLADAPKVHIVVKGDSLEKIAKQHGTTIADLQKLNSITDPKKLQIGQQLVLPPEKKE